MSEAIKKILTDKKSRDNARIEEIVSESVVAGRPWAD